jgi:hypothetical protein
MHVAPPGGARDPEATAKEVLAAVEAAGSKLIEALITNLAAGQVETLHALHVSAAALQRQGQRIAESGSQLERSADAASQRVIAGVSSDLSQRVSDLMEAAIARGAGAAGELVQRLTADLTAAAAQARNAMVTDLTSTQEALAAAARDAEAKGLLAREALEWAATEVALRLEAATTTLEAQSSASDRMLAAAGDTIRANIDTAGTAAARAVAAAAAEAAGLLLSSADAAVAQINEAKAGLDSFLASVDQEVSAWRARDTKQAAKIDERVSALIASTETAVGRVAGELQQQTDRLAARDRELEAQRVDEFVRALEDVLAKAGLRGRRVRKRVTAVLEETRPEPPPSAELPRSAPTKRARRTTRSEETPT